MKHSLLMIWLLTLIAALAGLIFVGDSFAPLPGPSFEAWTQWPSAVGYPAAVFALARLVGVAAGSYLLIVTVLTAATSILNSCLLTRLVTVITVRSTRRFIECSLGLTIAGSISFSAAANAANVNDVPVMVHVPHATTTTTTASAPAITSPTNAPAGPIELERSTPEPTQLQTWTIRSGENLWVVADNTLTHELERRPTDAELTAYWHRLVEQNRSILRDPGVPDLIYTGQQVLLPPL